MEKEEEEKTFRQKAVRGFVLFGMGILSFTQILLFAISIVVEIVILPIYFVISFILNKSVFWLATKFVMTFSDKHPHLFIWGVDPREE